MNNSHKWRSALGIGAKLMASAFALVLFLGMAKKPPVPPHPPAHIAITGEAVAPLIKQYLQLPPDNNLDLATLRHFYEARNYAPIWMDKARGEPAFAAVAQAGDDGLDPNAYHADALMLRKRGNTPAAIAEFDLLLTDGLLKYAHDMRKGRVVPYAVEHDVGLPEVNFDAAAALTAALSANSVAKFIAGVTPPHAQYVVLKNAYIRYREIDSRGGWPEITADADDAVLAKRLAFEDTDPSADTAEALKRYQSRNGLDASGKLDKPTLAFLNVSASERANQIMLNMERWRWVPNFGPRYIEVNTADATLKVLDGGNLILASRIIAGKPASPTPIFEAMVTDVTVNPPWNIPRNIAKNEMLPKLRRNPGYLASQHITLVNGPSGDPYGLSINWRAVSAAHFPYTLQQTPGDDNALGYVKLEMPNHFDSYLHDTPSRSLFARADRHLSHGCMRVQEIQPLASYALTGNVNDGLTQIKSAIETHVTQHISLDRKLPVYVLYWTAIADADGTAGFRPDVYGRDTMLLAALAGQRPAGRVSMIGTECSAG